MKALVFAPNYSWFRRWVGYNDYSTKDYHYVLDERDLHGYPREAQVIVLVWNNEYYQEGTSWTRMTTSTIVVHGGVEYYDQPIRYKNGECYLLSFTKPVTFINDLNPDPHAQPQ